MSDSAVCFIWYASLNLYTFLVAATWRVLNIWWVVPACSFNQFDKNQNNKARNRVRYVDERQKTCCKILIISFKYPRFTYCMRHVRVPQWSCRKMQCGLVCHRSKDRLNPLVWYSWHSVLLDCNYVGALRWHVRVSLSRIKTGDSQNDYTHTPACLLRRRNGFELQLIQYIERWYTVFAWARFVKEQSIPCMDSRVCNF